MHHFTRSLKFKQLQMTYYCFSHLCRFYVPCINFIVYWKYCSFILCGSEINSTQLLKETQEKKQIKRSRKKIEKTLKNALKTH